MASNLENYCNTFADRCIAQYSGQRHLTLGPEMMPKIGGDPEGIEVRIEQLIMEQLPEVVPSAHVDGHGRMTVKLNRRAALS